MMKTHDEVEFASPEFYYGQYVVIRSRKDGTKRVAFEVPKRLRSEGWPPTIPLPSTNRRGDLNDPDERERIKEDAAALLKEMNAQKMGARVPPIEYTWERLASLWQHTSRFLGVKIVTQINYHILTKRILRYLAKHPELRPESICESGVEDILAEWNYSKDMKASAFTVMKFLMQKARKEKWRPDDPTSEIVCPKPAMKTRKVMLWDKNDVDRMVEACRAHNQSGIAKLILIEWEIGQRLTDARQFKYGVEYIDGVFRYYQSKTNSYVTVPISDTLRALLDTGKIDGTFLIINSINGLPFSEHDLGKVFAAIRKSVPEYDTRRIKLRNLRHSCVVQLALAECEVYEIGSITGHSFQTLHRILEHYLPRDSALAFSAVRKRRLMDEAQQAAAIA